MDFKNKLNNKFYNKFFHPHLSIQIHKAHYMIQWNNSNGAIPKSKRIAKVLTVLNAK